MNSYISPLIKYAYSIYFSSFCHTSSQAGVCFKLLPVYTYCILCVCVFGCCRNLSRTSICHGTIALNSKRSAAVMWVEGALLLLLVDVVFGHVPIPAQTRLLRHSWWAACLSVRPLCPPHRHPDLQPPHHHHHPSSITPPVAHKLTTVPLSCLTGSEVKWLECWSILWRQHPIIASYSRKIPTHTHKGMHTKRSTGCDRQWQWY